MERRGSQLEHTFLARHGYPLPTHYPRTTHHLPTLKMLPHFEPQDSDRVLLRYRLPLGEIAADFADALKSRSTGCADTRISVRICDTDTDIRAHSAESALRPGL